MQTNATWSRRLLPAIAILAATLLAAEAASAETSIAVDAATGKVLSQNNATARWFPASTTKLMTAYLALKAMHDGKAALDTPVVMTRRAAAEAPSKMGFQPGTVVRLDNALRMMLVKSANDLAMAIGQTLGGGSMDDFVDMMNQTAARLGMKDTHYINPNGLPGDGQYSSAKDLAILAIAIRTEFPAFSDYFGTEAVKFGNHLIKNGNKLLGRFDGADGMKTGYICASGFNLVSSATRGGRTVVAVVLGAEGPIVRERESAKLLQDGFATDPAQRTLDVHDLPTSSGPAADVSKEICSASGRHERSEEREAEKDREEYFGSPYMHEMNRPPQTVQVAIGGAAGTATIPAGISLIEAYGIPIPTPRPAGPGDLAANEAAPAASGDAAEDEAPTVRQVVAEEDKTGRILHSDAGAGSRGKAPAAAKPRPAKRSSR